MPKIMELYDEINHLKNKLSIEDEIKNLQKKETDAKIRGDFYSREKFKNLLRRYDDVDRVSDIEKCENDIKIRQNKIYEIILDYYNKGVYIEEIFDAEKIPKKVQKEWLSLSNFGKNTGFIFVDEVNDNESYNWEYYNPITNLELYAFTLSGLKSKLVENNDKFTRFDKKLVKKANERDLKIYQGIIDENLKCLNDSNNYDTDEIFQKLKKYGNKFSESQVYELFDFVYNNIEYFDYFNHILKDSKYNFDDIYAEIIEKEINSIDDNDFYSYKNAFDCLKKCSDKFFEEHVIMLFEVFDDYSFFDDFNYILEDNKDKFSNDFLVEIYSGIIDKGIAKLEVNNYTFTIMDSLEKCSIYFNQNQLNALFEFIILDNRCFEYLNDFNTILTNNKIDDISKFITKSIDNVIERLKDFNLNPNHVSDLFGYLNSNSKFFTLEQLNGLFEITINNMAICNFADDLTSIISENIDKFDYLLDEIYERIIDSKIKILKDLNSFNINSKYVINDLKYFSRKFSEKQYHELVEIVINNSNIVDFAQDFDFILNNNKEYINRGDWDGIHEKCVENRIQKLKNSNPKSGFAVLFDDLNFYSKFFNKNQCEEFVGIIEEGDYSQCCGDAILEILSVNKDKLGDKFEDINVRINIDVKLKQLDELQFSYTPAKRIVKYINKNCDKLSKNQIDDLSEILLYNNQIYKCRACNKYIINILENIKDKIDEKIYKKIINKKHLEI